MPGSRRSHDPWTRSALEGATGLSPAVGYSIVIPPEWRKIPVRDGAGQAVREIVDEVFGAIPSSASPDRVGPYRKELESQLMRMVRDAREKAGIDLYLPVVPVHGAPVGASFVVSELSLGPADPATIVTHLVAENDAAMPVTVDEAIGLRIERKADPSPANDIAFGSRRVDYVLKVPGDSGRWVAVAFSTLGGGDPDDDIADLLVGLFDAMMSTFRWQREEH